MKNYLVIILAILSGYKALCQSYPLGLSSPKIDWKQIETEKVEVIFPSESEHQAQRVANMVHLLYDSAYYSLGDGVKKVSIILQNQGVRSNGFVTVGPFRSEFYTNAPQLNFAGTTDWMDMLTIHEYRHVEQFSNAQRGITKLAATVLGENAWGLMAGMAMPRWFFEGDAIYYETLLTNAGRGRMPAFENEYRALALEGRKFNYEKASATSLREFVPNHYNLGYLMTTYMRNKYGEDIWQKVVQDAVRYRGLIFPFNKALKKYTGLRSPKRYTEMMEDLTQDWKKELENIELTEFEKINSTKKRTFVNYQNPRFLVNGDIVVEKNGFNEIPGYYVLSKDGDENKLLRPGIYQSGNATLDVNGELMVWAETRYNARWANETYSVIMTGSSYDGTQSPLTRKTRYFAPALSPDSWKIAAIHAPPSQYFELHVIHRADTSVAKRIKIEPDDQYAFPDWITDDTLAVIVRRNSRNAIALIDAGTGAYEFVTPFWREQISYLNAHEDRIYFSGTFTGVDNVFYLDLATREVFQLTSSKYGATQPDIHSSGKKMLYADYTPDGYDIAMVNIDELDPKKLQKEYQTAVDLYESEISPHNILSKIPTNEFDVSRFRLSEGLLNLHSWYPYFFPPNFSIELSLDNKMSTFSANAAANYNVNEDRISYELGATYGEKFLALDANFVSGRRNRYVPLYQETNTGTDSVGASLLTVGQEWYENDINMGAVLPLNLTSGNTFKRLWFSYYLHMKDVNYENDEIGTDELFWAQEFRANFYILQRMARQFINPRLGISANFTYKNTLGTTANAADYLNINAVAFFPGLFKTHSFYINGAMQRENFESQYKFRDNFFYARGYFATPHERINRIGFNYELPLWYPDIAVGPFLFIQRIKSNFFYDISSSSGFDSNVNDLTPISPVSLVGAFEFPDSQFSSYGAEVTFDFRFIRLLDMDLGFRVSRLLDDQPGIDNATQFDFIIRSIGY